MCCLSSLLPPNSVRYPQATVLLTQTLCSTPYPLHLGLVDRFLKLVTKSGLLRLQLFSGPQYPGTRVRGQLLPEVLTSVCSVDQDVFTWPHC